MTPLVSVPATEQGSGQTAFTSSTYYPAGIASVSYFDALGNGATRLLVTPVQHKASNIGSVTRRAFNNLDLKLFYSNFSGIRNVDGQAFRPSIAAAPSIVGVTATVNGSNIDFDAHVNGDPSAGVQKVWVTYTGFNNTWQSIDLTVDPLDATHFVGSLPVPSGHSAPQILFMVQAVNGTGLVSADLNGGAYYSITQEVAANPNATTVTFDPASGSINPPDGTYGSTVTFSATLTGADTNNSQPIVFSLGGNTLTGITDINGHASVTWPLIQAPFGYNVTASFAGNVANIGSFASAPFSLVKAQPTLTLTFGPSTPADSGIVATLKDDHNAPMDQRTVYFVITDNATAANSLTKTVITKANGSASVGTFPLPAGGYTVRAYFLGIIPLLPSVDTVTLTDEAYNPDDSGPAQAYTATAKAKLTVAFTVLNRPYNGGTAATITACSLIGVAGSATNVDCSFSGATATFADTTPSTFKTVTGTGFTLTGTDSGKYEIANPIAYTTAAISPAAQTITFGNVPAEKKLGDPDFTVTATASSGLTVALTAAPAGTCTITSTLVHLAGIGTCTITANQAGNGNWTPAPPVSATINVIWPFTGFFQPVDSVPTVNTANAGQAIPVKFSLGGNRGLEILQTGFPKVAPMACNASSPLDGVETYVTATNSTLQYDASTGQYTYVWKTAKTLAGKCWQFQLGLKDGNTVPVANFKFK